MFWIIISVYYTFIEKIVDYIRIIIHKQSYLLTFVNNCKEHKDSFNTMFLKYTK